MQLDLDAIREGLLEEHNIPNASGLSPTRKLFGKPLYSFAFAHYRSFALEWQLQTDLVDARADQVSTRHVQHYDKSSRSLPQVKRGMALNIQDPQTKKWLKRSIIIAISKD